MILSGDGQKFKKPTNLRKVIRRSGKVMENDWEKIRNAYIFYYNMFIIWNDFFLFI